MSPYNAYFGDPKPPHGGPGAADTVGVLVSNLGTPDAPTAPALRRYLREFLSDPRVIEANPIVWKLVLELVILPRRPKVSAELYRKVWSEEGSPLLAIGRRQAAGIADRLAAIPGAPPVHVALGMRYGQPAIGGALRELFGKGARRIVVLPLYPQYFSGTGGSTFDAVAAELVRWRWVPELRVVQHYHDEPAYVAALARSIAETWERSGERPEKLVFSFHGIPVRYFAGGDPYFCHCQKTARLVAQALDLPEDRWEVTFQSLFGKEEWIKPYTDRTLQAMARSGIRRVDVLCPGFAADCLETLEEIAGLNRELFEHAGGERLRYIPCLNDRADHLDLLADVIRRTAGEWLAPRTPAEAAASAADRARGAMRAAAMAAAPRPADGGYGASGV